MNSFSSTKEKISDNPSSSKLSDDIQILNKLISEIELLESINSYDQFKQSRDVVFNEKSLAEESSLLEKNFRKEIFNFEGMDEINFNKRMKFEKRI